MEVLAKAAEEPATMADDIFVEMGRLVGGVVIEMVCG